MGEAAMSHCERFAVEIEQSIGGVLRQLGLVFKFADETDGCRLLYWSPRRDVCIYESFRNGDVNCHVLDRTDSRGQWITIREATGYGAGMTEAELEALMPEGVRPNDEILREIGGMLLQLPW